MHAHDRTLLSQLGFSDPDKKDARHDLACQYLATRDVSMSLVTQLAQDWIDKKHSEFQEFSGLLTPSFEELITKGEGQYRTVIGFCDLLIRFKKRVGRECGGVRCCTNFVKGTIHYDDYKGRICVEVKITPQSIGNILRQLNLYREFLGYSYASAYFQDWVLATAFPLSQIDIDSLRHENVNHVQLGPRFDEFCAASRNRADVASEDTILV